MGLFTQPDPIGLAGGLNTYGYAGGDPVNYSDPFGLCKVRVGWTDTPVPGTKHAFIEVTRPDNTRVIFRGGPTGENLPASSNNSSESSKSPSGDSRSESVAGPILAETQSPDDPGSDAAADPAPEYDEPLVDDDKSCAKYERSFSSTERRINQADIPYGLHMNSNSVVNTMLLRAGLGFLDASGRRAPGAASVLPVW